MKILYLTDLHGESTGLEELPEADLLIIGGDVTNFGNAEAATRVLDLLAEAYPRVFAVSGNCDHPDVETLLQSRDWNLHFNSRESEGCVFFGVGGCNTTPFNTPNEWDEEECAGKLAAFSAPDSPLILVSHAPPLDSGADRLPNDGPCVGSRAIADFVAAARPSLVLCGHIHEAVGKFDVDGIPVVNPGSFREGCYAVVEWDGESPEISLYCR